MDWSFPPLLPATRNLLIVSAVAFVVSTLIRGLTPVPIDLWLGLSSLPGVGWSWQWLTHWIVDGASPGAAPWKLLELVGLYYLGSRYESVAGQLHTYFLAIAAVVGSSLALMATGWITPAPSLGALSLTSAFLIAFASRSRGAPLAMVLMPTLSSWALVAIWTAVNALSSVSFGYVQFFAAYVGTLGGAYAYERLIASRPATKPPGKDGVRRKKASHPFRVIEGGGQSSDDDDKPKYLN